MSDLRLLASAFDAVSWQMAILDADGDIVRVNRAWEEFGRENTAGGVAVQGAGSSYLDVCRAAPREEGYSGRQAAEGIEEVLAGERDEFRMEYPCHAPERKRWFLMSVRPLGGDRPGAVVSHIEITERKTAEDRLAHQALHDPLTDLANRRLFMDRARRALLRQGRGGGRTAIAYLDLDGFKRINDEHGHEAGDEVLRRVAERIEEAVREGDTAARLGGDEFGILLEEVTDAGDAEGAVLRILDRLEAADGTGEGPTGPRGLAASAGLALAREGADDPEELLGRADRAMYETKAGRGRIAVADDGPSGPDGAPDAGV